MPFIQFPRILGHELGVEVLAVGAGVTNVAVGDCCSVEPYMNCGTCHACLQGKTNCCETLTVLGVHGDGGMCERLLLPAHKLHRGGNLSFEQLALVETLAIGCHAVNRATISKNDSVLIIGAGPIGLSVFVERHYPNVKVLAASPAENSAQIIFDATGSPASMSSATKYARFTGRIIFVGITKEPVTLDDPLFHRRELTLLASRNAIASDFTRIIDLIQRNVIDTQPWISHRAHFNALPETFPDLLLPESGVIKAVVML
jgi:threonine dehydrogenase-like Zn-dependent dehydrogenase